MHDSLILTLLQQFSASSVSELDLQDGAFHLVLKKAPGQGDFKQKGCPEPRLQDDAPPPGTGEAGTSQALDAPVADTPGEPITSPMVATFYASPNPDTPAFVSPGSQVKAGATLCILEAMKMMNRLEADFDCEILAVHAGNGDLVEYGQVLFEVKRIGPSP